MSIRTKTIEELAELEDDFQATAFDPRFKDDNKFALLSSILEGMTNTVFRSFKTTEFDCYDVSEYVQDFCERSDLGRAMVDQAFHGEGADIYKSKMNALMNYALVNLAMYSRPVENYRLEP